jgi:hypothetical protein
MKKFVIIYVVMCLLAMINTYGTYKNDSSNMTLLETNNVALAFVTSSN